MTGATAAADGDPPPASPGGAAWGLEWALAGLVRRLAGEFGLGGAGGAGAAALADPRALAAAWREQGDRRRLVRPGAYFFVGRRLRAALAAGGRAHSPGGLAELRRAGRFAAAAYGTALESLHSLPRMGQGVVAEVARRLACGVHPDAGIRLGLEVGEEECSRIVHDSCEGADVIFWHRDPSLFVPVLFIAVDAAHGWVVVSVRGTLATTDAVTDLCAETVPFLGGRAHAGFSASAWQLLKMHGARLGRALWENPGHELMFTGHSMGAAVASLAAMLLRSRDRDVEALLLSSLPSIATESGDQGGLDGEAHRLGVLARARAARCLGLATPCVVSLELSRRCPYVLSCVLGKDVIPRLSKSNFRTLVARMQEGAGRSWTDSATEVLLGPRGRTSVYELRDFRDEEFLVIPGLVVHLRHVTSAQGPTAEVRDPTAFSEIRLTLPRMFTDHMPLEYLWALEKVEGDLLMPSGPCLSEGEELGTDGGA